MHQQHPHCPGFPCTAQEKWAAEGVWDNGHFRGTNREKGRVICLIELLFMSQHVLREALPLLIQVDTYGMMQSSV